jgi:hypothetical protein
MVEEERHHRRMVAVGRGSERGPCARTRSNMGSTTSALTTSCQPTGDAFGTLSSRTIRGRRAVRIAPFLAHDADARVAHSRAPHDGHARGNRRYDRARNAAPHRWHRYSFHPSARDAAQLRIAPTMTGIATTATIHRMGMSVSTGASQR